MIVFAFVLFAALVLAWLFAPTSAHETVAEPSPSTALQMGDAVA